LVTIRVRDYAPLAATHEDGDVIFRLVADALRAGSEVTVSFNGIAAVPSAFINSAFVRLIDTVPFEEIRERVHFSESTKAINDLLRTRLTFAAKGQPPTA
jgi:hypothetical protein